LLFFVCPAVISAVLLLFQVQFVFHIMLERASNRETITFALLQDLHTTECMAWSHHMLACTASPAVANNLMENH